MNNFYLSPEGGRYYLGTQFTYEDRIYFGTVETFASLGFPEVVVQPMPNPTYYTVGNVNDDGSWNYTAKPVADVQASQSAGARSNTFNTLQPSDWYVVRQQENGTPVPADWGSYRQGCRTACETYVAAIGLASTTEELEAVGSSVYFPPNPDSQGGFAAVAVKGESTLQIHGSPLQATSVLADLYVKAEGYIEPGTKVVSANPITGIVTLDQPVLKSSNEGEFVIVSTSWQVFS